MKTRLLLYTVPGQVYYNATRKLVLKGVDAVVFVADSAADKMAENRESFANLEQNLKAYGIDIKTIPLVLQYNKRDLPTALPVAELNKELNRLNVPTYEAQAANGIGVFETLRGVSKLLLAKITKDVLEKDKGAVQGLARAKEKAAKAEASAAAAKKHQEQEKQSSGGKLLKYLKRGKGQDESAETEDRGAEAPAPPAMAPSFEPTPMLGDDALMDDAPVAEMPVPLNAEEELVLTEEDMIPHAPPGAPPLPVEPARAPMVGARSSDEESLGDFERDPGVPSSGFSRQVSATTTVPGDGRRVSVPIDLGALPRSGKVTLMVEISIRVESDEPAPKKVGGKKAEGFDDSFTRDLEPIP